MDGLDEMNDWDRLNGRNVWKERMEIADEKSGWMEWLIG